MPVSKGTSEEKKSHSSQIAYFSRNSGKWQNEELTSLNSLGL